MSLTHEYFCACITATNPNLTAGLMSQANSIMMLLVQVIRPMVGLGVVPLIQEQKSRENVQWKHHVETFPISPKLHSHFFNLWSCSLPVFLVSLHSDKLSGTQIVVS